MLDSVRFRVTYLKACYTGCPAPSGTRRWRGTCCSPDMGFFGLRIWGSTEGRLRSSIPGCRALPIDRSPVCCLLYITSCSGPSNLRAPETVVCVYYRDLTFHLLIYRYIFPFAFYDRTRQIYYSFISWFQYLILLSFINLLIIQTCVIACYLSTLSLYVVEIPFTCS